MEEILLAVIRDSEAALLISRNKIERALKEKYSPLQKVELSGGVCAEISQVKTALAERILDLATARFTRGETPCWPDSADQREIVDLLESAEEILNAATAMESSVKHLIPTEGQILKYSVEKYLALRQFAQDLPAQHEDIVNLAREFNGTVEDWKTQAGLIYQHPEIADLRVTSADAELCSVLNLPSYVLETMTAVRLEITRLLERSSEMRATEQLRLSNADRRWWKITGKDGGRLSRPETDEIRAKLDYIEARIEDLDNRHRIALVSEGCTAASSLSLETRRRLFLACCKVATTTLLTMVDFKNRAGVDFTVLTETSEGFSIVLRRADTDEQLFLKCELPPDIQKRVQVLKGDVSRLYATLHGALEPIPLEIRFGIPPELRRNYYLEVYQFSLENGVAPGKSVQINGHLSSQAHPTAAKPRTRHRA
jgi:hypothetical protein